MQTLGIDNMIGYTCCTPHEFRFAGGAMMFNGIILGGLCSLIGIGIGYLILNAFFAGVQHISKPRIAEIKKVARKILDN